MAKVQISIDDELLCKVDNYCKDMFITRSGFISLLCSQYIQKDEVTKTLNILQNAIIKITEGQELTPEQEQELDDYMRVLSLLNSSRIK